MIRSYESHNDNSDAVGAQTALMPQRSSDGT